MAQRQFPEPTVGALILGPDGRLLLMRSHKWRNNHVVVPGGRIELGERMEDALRREVKNGPLYRERATRIPQEGRGLKDR
jgi:ADP-ribose pyrophosphatase YjhB (NUDIX family)